MNLVLVEKNLLCKSLVLRLGLLILQNHFFVSSLGFRLVDHLNRRTSQLTNDAFMGGLLVLVPDLSASSRSFLIVLIVQSRSSGSHASNHVWVHFLVLCGSQAD